MNFELLTFGDTGWGDEMVRAAGMTFAVACSAYLLGLVIGTFGAAAKLSRSLVLRGLGDAYTTVIRGVPDLLVLYLLFFGGSQAAGWVAGLFGYDGYVEVDSFTIGTIAIGGVAGAYATEVIRGAVLTIAKGEIEAAKAVGMSGLLLFRRILAPQAARFALPGLGNVWQLVLKDTALISLAGLVEIMRQAGIGAGSTQEPFTFYLTAAILYLVLTSLSNKGFGSLELWANRGVRRA